MTFEEKLKELEKVVNNLENNTGALNDTVSLYEKGVKLAASCNKMLDEAEQKITVLTKSSDGLAEQPFKKSGE